MRAMLARWNTTIGRIERFLGRIADLEDLESRIAAAETALLAAESAQNDAESLLLEIYDHMLEYPPDWAARSAAVRKRYVVCSECGSDSMLQAHHVVPLSKGGTNRLANLTWECTRFDGHLVKSILS